MDLYCPTTGEKHCKCGKHQLGITSMKVDIKAVFRKLFTDHAVYTKFVINDIIDGNGSLGVFLNRLMDNQKDIGDQLKPIIGDRLGNEATRLLKEHIRLAGEVIKKIAANLDSYMAIDELLVNSDQVAAFLHSLNPDKLPLNHMIQMFETHNIFVKDMAEARHRREYEKEQKLYDAYYNEMLEMSDEIVNAL